MAGSSSSLVVKISADINSFTAQLNAMTKGVDQAAAKIEKFGKAITIGITVPITAAAVALAKMAAENEDTGARLERVFGSAASSVNASIQAMMKSVPESNTDLQKMAISAQNMALGLGLAPAKASEVSESLLKLAADASAFAHIPMEEALDKLEHGLAGKTKGLIDLGIAFNETEIKQRAYDMNLLHTGHDLTETGTALAAYSLILEKSPRLHGEAARTADQMGKSFTFLKRDLSELADNNSAKVLPSMSALANTGREIVKVFAGLDPQTVKTFFTFAAGAAIIGPLVVVVVRLIDAFVKIRAAIVLLSAGGGIAGIIAAIAALPAATIVAGIVAITAALGGLYLIYKKIKGTDAGATVAAIPLSSVGTITHQAPNDAQLKKFFGPGGERDQATERESGTPLEQFKRHADAITKGYDAAVEHGRPLTAFASKINGLYGEAARLLKSQGGAFTETAQAAQDVLDRVEQIKNALALANAATPDAQKNVLVGIARSQKTGFNAPQQAAADVSKETFDRARDLELRFAKIQLPKLDTSGFEAVVKALEDTRAKDEALSLREALLTLPDGFNAVREATIEFSETQRQYAEDLQKRLLLSQKPSGFNAGTEARIQSNEAVKSNADNLALREQLVLLPDGFNAARQAAVEFAEAQRGTTEAVALKYETLRLQLDQFGIHLGNLGGKMQVVALTIADAAIQFAQTLVANAGGSGKGASFGRSLGGFAGTIAGALLGPAGSVAGALVGSAIGGVIGTGLGGLIGGSFDHAKKSTDGASSSLDTLSKTVDRVTESITNVPAWFKAQIDRFEAAPTHQIIAVTPAPPPPTGGTPIQPSNPGGGPDAPSDPKGGSKGNRIGPSVTITGNVILPGVQNARQLLQELTDMALRTSATGSAASIGFASSGLRA